MAPILSSAQRPEPSLTQKIRSPWDCHPMSGAFEAELRLCYLFKKSRLFMRSGVLRQENRKQGVQGCLAASSDVVQALKEGQVEGEFFLGNPPVWAQPGAQQ